MVEIKNISFEDSVNVIEKLPAIKNVSLDIKDGKITSVIAPANSGKTLLLKIISGLHTPFTGEIVSNVEKIIYLPGKAASFPWLTVFENVSFGLRTIDDAKIKKLINVVGLEGYDKHFANNKSLGFRFRIALARSLAHDASLILLDEPFCQMNDITKKEVLQLVREVNKNLKVSFLLATSNITEAIFLSDKIYLLRKNPLEVFHEEEVKYARERKESTLKSEKFIQLCTQFCNLFKTEDPQNLFNISI